MLERHAIGLGLMLTFANFAGEAVAPSAEQLREWIGHLGDGALESRDAAERKLVETGESAIPTLEEGAKSQNPEVRARCQGAIEAIRQERRWGHLKKVVSKELWAYEEKLYTSERAEDRLLALGDLADDVRDEGVIMMPTRPGPIRRMGMPNEQRRTPIDPAGGAYLLVAALARDSDPQVRNAAGIYLMSGRKKIRNLVQEGKLDLKLYADDLRKRKEAFEALAEEVKAGKKDKAELKSIQHAYGATQTLLQMAKEGDAKKE